MQEGPGFGTAVARTGGTTVGGGPGAAVGAVGVGGRATGGGAGGAVGVGGVGGRATGAGAVVAGAGGTVRWATATTAFCSPLRLASQTIALISSAVSASTVCFLISGLTVRDAAV